MALDKERLEELIGHVLRAAQAAFGDHLRGGILKGSGPTRVTSSAFGLSGPHCAGGRSC